MALPRDTGVIVAGGRRWPCTGPAPTVAPATTSAIWPWPATPIVRAKDHRHDAPALPAGPRA